MIPKVVIVGRPNVGKSSLLNLLAGRRVSIVDATPGITRDRVSAMVQLPDDDSGDRQTIELIDTGGYGIEDSQNLTAEVEQQIAIGVAEADLILFVTDAQSGLLPLDREVAQLLRSEAGQTPVLLVANKVDGPSHEPEAYETLQIGLGEPTMVSATSGRHKADLLETIRGRIGQIPDAGEHRTQTSTDTGVLLAIVGKRNAGKSTLVNTLAGELRVIVSETEGTTRDAVDVHFDFDGRVFTAIDTAGARKRKSIREDVEFYSHHRALRSIRRAHVVLLLIDSSVPVSQVDAKLAGEIMRHHKPCVIVVNKWDLAETDHTQEQYLEYLDDALKGLSFAPIAFISATRDEGVRDVAAMALNLYQQAGHRISTGQLNRLVESIVTGHGPVSRSGRRPKIYYVTQLSTYPPTIGLFVNQPELFDNTYQRFLLGRLRDEVPFAEVPIKLIIRPRSRMPKQTNEQS